jgi:hypothetical protein
MNIEIEFDGSKFSIPEENSVSLVSEIQKNRWRGKRNHILADLDIQFLRAIEENDDVKKQEIINKKNTLRDITKTEMPLTIDEILNFWPDILN